MNATPSQLCFRRRLFPFLSLVALLAAQTAASGCAKTPNELEIKPESHTFAGVGQNLWFEATPRVRNGQRYPKLMADVRWTSDDPAVVEVDIHGRATSTGAGKTNLTAAYGNMTYRVPVEVQVVDKIELGISSLELAVTGTESEIVRTPAVIESAVFDTLGNKLIGQKPVLACEDENVCRTANEKVVPVDAGETYLTARLGGAQAKIPVKVVNQVKKDAPHRGGTRNITF